MNKKSHRQSITPDKVQSLGDVLINEQEHFTECVACESYMQCTSVGNIKVPKDQYKMDTMDIGETLAQLNKENGDDKNKQTAVVYLVFCHSPDHKVYVWQLLN